MITSAGVFLFCTHPKWNFHTTTGVSPMKIRLAVFVSVILTSQTHAAIIEPDNYALGTDLSTISPDVTFSVSGGGPVFAGPIGNSGFAAANGYSTGPFGQQVFTPSPTHNSEWFYWPGTPGWEENALQIDFTRPVTSISLLIGELFTDAGCCNSDPLAISIYDSKGDIVQTFSSDVIELNDVQYLGTMGDPFDEWPYGTFNFAAEDIGRIIIGGESEPVTIDRLEYQKQVSAPVPGTLGLFVAGLLGLKLTRQGRRSLP